MRKVVQGDDRVEDEEGVENTVDSYLLTRSSDLLLCWSQGRHAVFSFCLSIRGLLMVGFVCAREKCTSGLHVVQEVVIVAATLKSFLGDLLLGPLVFLRG
jgi:hypothetical protein